MAEEIVLNINVNGDQSISEVKNLKQQFAEAEDALFKLAGAGKEGTKEFRNAQQAAAGLKERVDDINESLDDLKPEAKLGAFTRVAGGLASGFTAATGAAALFGAESEDLQKQLVKVQAAMAFSEGLRGLGDLADGFKTLKAVILANPLFLIVGIVTSIGVALFALKDKIGIVGKAFDGLGKGLDFVVQKIKNLLDAIGISEFALDEQNKKLLERNAIAIKSIEDKYEKEIRAAKRAHEDTEAIEIQKIKTLAILNENRIKLLKDGTDAQKEEAQELIDINKEYHEKVLDLQAIQNDKLKALRVANKVEIKEEKKKDKEEAIVEAEIDLEALVNEAESERVRLADIDAKIAERQKKRREDELAAEKALFDAEIAMIDDKAKKQSDSLQQAENLTNLFFTTKLNNAVKGSKEEEKILKQQFKINQAFQIGQALINGASAITKGIAQFGPPPSPAGIAAIASATLTTGLQVAAIKSAKFQGGGSGGGSVSSTPTSTSSSAPSVNAPSVNAPTTITKLTDNSGQPQNQPVIKAFVVESDITNSQANVSKIASQATF